VKDSRNAGVSAVLYEQGICLYFTERWALRSFCPIASNERGQWFVPSQPNCILALVKRFSTS